MSQEFHFEFPLPNGLHARPASQLAESVSRFSSAVTLGCGRNAHVADARSVLSLISADIRRGDPCVLRVTGDDEDAAFASLVEYLTTEFAHCDEALPPVGARQVPGTLPRVLAALGVKRWWTGEPVSGSIAIAPVVRSNGAALAEGFHWPPAEPAETERHRLAEALGRAKTALEAQIHECPHEAADILRAQLGILADPSFFSRIRDHIGGNACCAGEAVMAVADEISATLRDGSSYLQERVADIRDVCARILAALYGDSAIRRAPSLTRPSILVSSELTPGQFLTVDRRHLAGIVLERGGGTSHTAILARAAGIPMIAGVAGLHGLADGMEVILDVRRGVLVAGPSDEIRSFYQREWERVRAQAAEAEGRSQVPAASADGVRLPCLANVSSVLEIDAAIGRGAEGVGLFRTELMFMNRDRAPDEEEQFAVYQEAVRRAGGRPLVIRTLDIGGDKPVSYMSLPKEENPFLGLRGVRLYERFPALIRGQLRAILRASAAGAVKIMVPMVSCVEEMSAFRRLMDEVRAELASEGRATGADLALGVMLEVPSAVFAIADLARFADFFSVGTNDLAQYFLAADRGNPSTVGLGSWQHPSFLRLLDLAVRSAHAGGRPISLCGDLASHPESTAVLLGLGFDSISMGAADIPRAKMALSKLESAAARDLLGRVLGAEDRNAVRDALSGPAAGSKRPLLARELFQSRSAAASKAEVINELVSLADASGLVKDAVALEEAVWAREETYPTNFGHGFAVPHCHTAVVSAPVIAFARLDRPIQWTAGEDGKVHIVFLLAMPAGENEAHLRIFARLSRMIMREEFRASLETAADSDALLSIMRDALSPVLP